MTRGRRYLPTGQTPLPTPRPGGEQPLYAADPPSAETGNRPGRSEAASPTSPVYTLGSNPAEQNRLRRQSDDLHPHALTMLARTGLQPGAATLDLGCGPRGTIELLSQRVGPTGRVTGMDVNPVHVDLARQLVLEKGLGNVEILQGDARRTGLPSATFDLVYARLLLINIPAPQEVMAEMARLTKPGGWVAIEEADAALQQLQQAPR